MRAALQLLGKSKSACKRSAATADGVRVFLSGRDSPLIAGISMRQRSSYPKPFKAQVVQECLQPGASVSSVAIRHG